MAEVRARLVRIRPRLRPARRALGPKPVELCPTLIRPSAKVAAAPLVAVAVAVVAMWAAAVAAAMVMCDSRGGVRGDGGAALAAVVVLSSRWWRLRRLESSWRYFHYLNTRTFKHFVRTA